MMKHTHTQHTHTTHTHTHTTHIRTRTHTTANTQKASTYITAIQTAIRSGQSDYQDIGTYLATV